MKRREAIKALTLLSGGTFLVSSGLFIACNSSEVRKVISDDDLILLDEIGETIIPKTAASGGAKEAKIGEYMRTMVNDCYTQENRAVFLEGLTKLENYSKVTYKADFLDLNKDQKKQLFLNLQTEVVNYKKENLNAQNKTIPPHYFELFKSLTLTGYFTSEIGATKARRYQAVPGKYVGCINYKKGDRAWATS